MRPTRADEKSFPRFEIFNFHVSTKTKQKFPSDLQRLPSCLKNRVVDSNLSTQIEEILRSVYFPSCQSSLSYIISLISIELLTNA